jgi:hypothetical protein
MVVTASCQLHGARGVKHIEAICHCGERCLSICLDVLVLYTCGDKILYRCGERCGVLCCVTFALACVAHIEKWAAPGAPM